VPQKDRTVMNECWSCQHKREVPGNYHIRCVKPDPDMKGNEHGIRKGWFMYPFLFDPTWKEKLCNNYQKIEDANSAVSGSVSGAV